MHVFNLLLLPVVVSSFGVNTQSSFRKTQSSVGGKQATANSKLYSTGQRRDIQGFLNKMNQEEQREQMHIEQSDAYLQHQQNLEAESRLEYQRQQQRQQQQQDDVFVSHINAVKQIGKPKYCDRYILTPLWHNLARGRWHKREFDLAQQKMAQQALKPKQATKAVIVVDVMQTSSFHIDYSIRDFLKDLGQLFEHRSHLVAGGPNGQARKFQDKFQDTWKYVPGFISCYAGAGIHLENGMSHDERFPGQTTVRATVTLAALHLHVQLVKSAKHQDLQDLQVYYIPPNGQGIELTVQFNGDYDAVRTDVHDAVSVLYEPKLTDAFDMNSHVSQITDYEDEDDNLDLHAAANVFGIDAVLGAWPKK